MKERPRFDKYKTMSLAICMWIANNAISNLKQWNESLQKRLCDILERLRSIFIDNEWNVREWT